VAETTSSVVTTTAPTSTSEGTKVVLVVVVLVGATVMITLVKTCSLGRVSRVVSAIFTVAHAGGIMIEIIGDIPILLTVPIIQPLSNTPLETHAHTHAVHPSSISTIHDHVLHHHRIHTHTRHAWSMVS
jgi:hypothetical protein